MTVANAKYPVAIIGAGLVGAAVFRELVLGWVDEINSGVPRELSSTIYITAVSEAELVYQLDKTQDLLQRLDQVDVAVEDRLTTIVHHGSHRLNIKSEPLDILPQGLTPTNVEDESFRKSTPLYSYLASNRPRSLIIGANLAAIVAYTEELEEIRTLILAWILTTLKRATDELGIGVVAIVGTTALGGQGTNMVWTHQSSQEMDSGLTAKILAAYGILGVLDRISWDTDSTTRWILLTPGSLLGYDYLDFGPVRYFSIPRGLPEAVEEEVIANDLSVPLYAPIGVDLDSLTSEEIHWSERRISGEFLSGAKIKCGETGDLTPLQFATISHPFQMGFNTDVYVAKILIEELGGRKTGFNQIPLGSGKVLDPTASGQNERTLALDRLAELELENGRRSPPVYPALGSPRAQKETVVADLLYRLLADRYGEPSLQQICEYDPEKLAADLWHYLREHPRLMAEITAVIPIISPEGVIYSGPHLMYLGKGITRKSDLMVLTEEERFKEFAALGAVDLRPTGERVIREPKIYETGVDIVVKRSEMILNNYLNVFSTKVVDRSGSAIDPRIRHWWTLTSGQQTIYDPVFFCRAISGW